MKKKLKSTLKRSSVFKNLKIGTKLIAGFTVVTVLIVLLSVLSSQSSSDMSYQINIYENTVKVEYLTALARLEQVRYENEVTSDSSDKVITNLDQAVVILNELESLMKSEKNKENAGKMIEQVNIYSDNFKEYVSLENQKTTQSSIRESSSINVIEEIKGTMIDEEEYIKTLNSSQDIISSFSKYKLLEDSLEYFMEARVSANKFLSSASDQDANLVKGMIIETRKSLQDAKEVILSGEVLLAIDRALSSLDQYENAFDSYASLVVQQSKTQEDMRSSAVQSSAIAADIEDGVINYIDNLKVSTDRLNIIITIIAIGLSIVIAYIITRSITKPISLIITYFDRVADYDLSENLPGWLLDRKDEIGNLSKALNKISTNLRDIITNILNSSQLLASSSEELSASSNLASVTSGEVTQTISEIANGANDQARTTEGGASTVIELGSLIENDQKFVGTLSDSAETVMKLKVEGFEILEFLVKETEKSNQSSDKVYSIVEETNDSAEKIEVASQMIRKIADQTNLLALNAAIEAARAGEAGRGFAVVADEIRKLAEQSNNFTAEIASTIQDLIVKSSTAVETMKISKAIVESQTKGVAQTSEKFNGISDSMEIMKEIINTIITSSVEMENKKVEIVGVMENLSAISEENAAGTEEVTSSMQEQTAILDQISQASEELAKLAEDLQEMVSRFRL